MQPLWRTVWRFLKKLKTERPYDPAIPHLCINLEKTLNSKGWKHSYTHCGTVYISQDMEALKCPPTDERIKKMRCIHMKKHFSAIKMNEIIPFAATWMDPGMIILSSVSQTEKQPSPGATHRWNLIFKK